MVDDHSRMTWLYFMKHKSETRNLLKGFLSYTERQFSKKVKRRRGDNGVEFLMPDFSHEKGVIHETT